MVNYESTLTHINGLEAKKILKSSAEKGLEKVKVELFARIDKIKYLVQGAAFPRFKAEYALVVTAYPSDVPVPEAEFLFAVNNPELSKAELQENMGKIEVLEAKRARLVEGIELIDKILSIHRPEIQIHETLNAGDIPDQLRIQENLPIPMIKTSESGRRSEVYVSAEELNR